MAALAQCPSCKWKYPEDLLTSLFINSAHTPPICAPCALEISNAAHQVKRNQFRGPNAEQLRREALRWRQRNPHHKPTKES